MSPTSSFVFSTYDEKAFMMDEELDEFEDAQCSKTEEQETKQKCEEDYAAFPM